MADLALVTAGRLRVVQSLSQFTGVADEAITIGDAVRLSTTTGKITKANATSATEGRFLGVAVKTAAAGEAVTVIRSGILDGFDLSGMDYDENVRLSDTDGKLGDANGTVTINVGRVIPAHAQLLGQSPDKLLFLEPHA